MATNKERLDANNEKIREIQETLENKILSVTKPDMLQARVDASSCAYLFYQYTGKSLDFIKDLDTSNVKNMSCMFMMCSNLQSLDLSNFNTANVTTMIQMFIMCSKLTSLNISNFDTKNVTNFSNMFDRCNSLINIIGTLNLYSATNLNAMFASCTKITDITLKNIKIDLQIGSGTSYGTLLSNESLINTIKELWDYSSGSTTYTLTMATASKNNIANIYVKLVTPTQEEINADPYINNKKPCVVCESTDEGAMTLTEYATSKKWAIA